VKIETEDHGGVAIMLDRLAEIYGLQTREAALKRAIEIASVLSEHADQLGHLHLIDHGPKWAPPHALLH